jgi:hypothetical protein
MPEQTLDVANVDAFFKEIRRHGVTEHVRCHTVTYLASFPVNPNETADHLRGGGVPARVDKESLGARVAIARDAVVSDKGFQVVWKEHSALSVAFADNRNCAIFNIDGRIEKTG